MNCYSTWRGAISALILLLVTATGVRAQSSAALDTTFLRGPFATHQTLTGSVVDELNTPLAGATVKLIGGGPPVLCITNSRGRYMLEVPATGGAISISYEGYQTQDFVFRHVISIDVELQPEPDFKRDRRARVVYRRLQRAAAYSPDHP